MYIKGLKNIHAFESQIHLQGIHLKKIKKDMYKYMYIRLITVVTRLNPLNTWPLYIAKKKKKNYNPFTLCNTIASKMVLYKHFDTETCSQYSKEEKSLQNNMNTMISLLWEKEYCSFGFLFYFLRSVDWSFKRKMLKW